MAGLPRRCILLLALCISGLAAAPPCRKSPELHTLVMREGSHKEEEAVAFGGKGFAWVRRGKGGKGGKKLSLAEEPEEPEEPEDLEEDDDDEEEEEEGEEEAGILLSERVRAKKQVQFFGDTWVYSLAKGSWTEVEVANGDKTPVSRWKPSSCTFDDGAGMALFGGCHGTKIRGVLNDLWVLRLKSPGKGEWEQIHTANPPLPRRGHITVASDTHLVVAGGKGWTRAHGTKVMTDLWILPLSALRGGKRDHWVQGTPFPGKPRWGSTGDLMHMPDGRQVIAFFGGRNKNPHAKFHSAADGAYTYYNDLYFYEFGRDRWELVEPKGKEIPCPRDHHAAATFGEDLYVFGGRTAEKAARSSTRSDLWSFSTKTMRWTLHPDGKGAAPVPRFMPGLTLRSNGDSVRAVVFAGQTLPGSTKRTSLNDVWAYDVGSDSSRPWKELFKSDCSEEATGLALGGEEEEVSQLRVLLLSLVALVMLGVPFGMTVKALRTPRSATGAASLLDGDLFEEPWQSTGYAELG